MSKIITIDTVISAVEKSLLEYANKTGSGFDMYDLTDESIFRTRVYTISKNGLTKYSISATTLTTYRKYPESCAYELFDSDALEALEFWLDDVKTYGAKEGIIFRSEPMLHLYNDFIGNITNPEYDLYGTTFDSEMKST